MEIVKAVKTMTSREVAELTGKDHAKVLRDIDTLLESLNPEMALGFKSTTYKDVTGKSNRMFEMDHDSSVCLVTGYDVNARMKVIKRWQELEQNVPVAKTLSSVLKDNHEIALFFGLEGNNAKIAANTATRKLTGTDPMALLEITLVAPVQERTMTPSDIGVQLGLSGIKVNQLLKDIGYQVDSRDAKERLVWTATAEGAKHSELSDTGKRQSDGIPVKQLKWFAHVVEDLRNESL